MITVSVTPKEAKEIIAGRRVVLSYPLKEVDVVMELSAAGQRVHGRVGIPLVKNAKVMAAAVTANHEELLLTVVEGGD